MTYNNLSTQSMIIWAKDVISLSMSKTTNCIVDLRNYVIHGYDKVDDVIIWGIINRDLPKLKEQVDSLMNQTTIL